MTIGKDELHAALREKAIAAIRAGKKLPKNAVAALVRKGDLPADVREYLADWIIGKRSKGRPVDLSRVQIGDTTVLLHVPKAVQSMAAMFEREELLREYDVVHEEMRQLKKNPIAYTALRSRVQCKKTKPNEVAFAVIANRRGVQPDTIRNKIKRAPLK